MIRDKLQQLNMKASIGVRYAFGGASHRQTLTIYLALGSRFAGTTVAKATIVENIPLSETL